MRNYRIVTPTFVAGVVVELDVVLQAAPLLAWSVGKQFEVLRDYCKQHGWNIEPVIEGSKPQWIEVDGTAYELVWNGEALTKVLQHGRNGSTVIRYRDLPERIKQIL